MFREDFIKKVNFFLYKKKHLIIYIFIGFFSLIFELLIRKLIFTYYGLESYLVHFSVFFGILFAFYFNIKLNFNVPKMYLRRSITYFFLISISSYLFQYFVRSKIDLNNFTFDQSRLIISSCFFLIAYFFHIKFSFKDSRKVGVAIYANGYEDVKKIYDKIGSYPDFIHVDIVDKTMNEKALDTNLSKLDLVKAYWSDHKIETHIMSKNPINLINEKILTNSDIIYVHAEIKNREEVVKKILDYKKIPGIVLHSIKRYENLENVIKNFQDILILSIEKPGLSGQKFIDSTYDLIEKLNSLKNRKNLNVCVDGGVKSNLINTFISEKVVSGSDVLNSENPIKKIMKLQTLSRYER